MRGLVLDHRYRLLQRLAAGGMGEVWRAVDTALVREVAIKLLRPELMADDEVRARFAAEARYAAAVRHPGIAQVYDAGEHDGRAYLVMELVPGEPLSRIIARTGGLAVRDVLTVVAQVADALSAAHAARIVHRDVKPANLLVSVDNTVTITDFGIARGMAGASHTQTGIVMGTALYLSPEQATGGSASPASDLYSLGVVAYEALAGVPPFDGDTPVNIALGHVREEPPPLPSRVPGDVRALVAELLAKDPADRPAGAAAVALRARSMLEARRVPEPRPQTDLIVAWSRFDGEGASDTLSRGRAGQRRTAGAFVPVAAGTVLLAAVAVGTLWRGPAAADLMGEIGDQVPAATSRPLPSEPPVSTVVPVTPTTEGRKGPRQRRIHPDRPARSTGPDGGPTRSPTPTPDPTRRAPGPAPTGPQPTPTPTETTPPAPDPAPAPTPGEGPGSEDEA